MRLVRIFSFPAFEVLQIGGIVPGKRVNIAIVLEGNDVACYTVQKPTVVGDNHGAAREIFECLFKGPDRVNVEIVLSVRPGG